MVLLRQKELSKVSGKPKEGYQWMAEVESATSLDQAGDPKGKDTLDLKVPAAYSRILHGELGAHLCLLVQKLKFQEKCYLVEKLLGTSKTFPF